MSLVLSDFSAALLPPEIKLHIFETCYFEYPDTLMSLFLVCREVFQRINAIRYFSVILHSEQDVKRMSMWIASQPPWSIQRHVKIMLINRPDPSLYLDIASLVNSCSGVVHLGLWLSGTELYPPDVLSRACLSLSGVRSLWLNSTAGIHLTKLLSSTSIGNKGPPRIAFQETLTHIDWGIVPRLSPEAFPNAAYIRMWLRRPFEDVPWRVLEAWVSRSNTKLLVLEVDDGDELSVVNLYEAGNPVLNHKKVILVPWIWPDQMEREWEKRWRKKATG